MKQTIILLSLILYSGLCLHAQTTNKKNTPPPYQPVPVYLANTYLQGSIKVDSFRTVLKKGLVARDSAGTKYPIQGFAFTYVERNLYADSLGNLIIVPDYLMEYCFGDTLGNFLLDNITDRSKSGDTVYIDKIKVLSPDGLEKMGQSLKLVLTK